MKKNIITGIHPILEAIKNTKPINKVFIKKGLRNKEIMTELQKANIPFNFVPIEKLNRITRTNHQGIIALVSPIEFQDIESLVPFIYENAKIPFIVILDRVTDVRNFGAIIRSAECMGVDAVIVPHKNTADINEDVIKTSAGAIFNVNICRVHNIIETINFLKNSGIKMVAITEKATNFLNGIDFRLPIAVIMGSENVGIQNSIRKISDEEAKIPMSGKTGSLNVSVAAGMTFYEIYRQRL